MNSCSVIGTAVLMSLCRQIFQGGLQGNMEHLYAGNIEVLHIIRSSWKIIYAYDITNNKTN
jgi:hypothetical protein